MGKLERWITNPNNSTDLLLTTIFFYILIINNIMLMILYKVGNVPAKPFINTLSFIIALIIFLPALFFLVYLEIYLIRKRNIIKKEMTKKPK